MEDYVELGGPAPVYRAATGELRWREGAGTSKFDGCITVDTARTKGFIGFAPNQEFVLGDVKIKPKSPFAAIYVTAKDRNAASIATADELLVLAVGRQRNTLMEYLPSGAIAGGTLNFNGLATGTSAASFNVSGSDGNSFTFSADAGKQLIVRSDTTGNKWLCTSATNQAIGFVRSGNATFNLTSLTFFNQVAATRSYTVTATFIGGSQSTYTASLSANQKKAFTFTWTRPPASPRGPEPSRQPALD